MGVIEDYKTIVRELMDDRGMLPPHNCKRCDKPLNGDGHHPAELYLGTYTGLCYSCERTGGYIITRYSDGAIQWSYPPHAPSWRRDRETFIAYPDCAECGGTGRHYVSRSFASGGSYYRYCETCLKRYSDHPKRKFSQETTLALFRAVNRMYNQEMARAGITDRSHPVAEQRAQFYIRTYDRVRDKVWARCNTVVEENKYGLGSNAG